jgi:hypothetical protein
VILVHEIFPNSTFCKDYETFVAQENCNHLYLYHILPFAKCFAFIFVKFYTFWGELERTVVICDRPKVFVCGVRWE